MTLNITINLDNAAFEDGAGGGIEAARLLRELADRYEDCGLDGRVQDILVDLNGNRVGQAKVTE